MLNKQPYLSVVVTARNDDHGGNLLGRMQAFVNAWIGQAKRHGLSSELIVVDWNPPQDRPPLIEAIKWPADTGPCQVRFIQVPAEIHSTYQHPAALPLYQMIAKNVAMRRSRGRFILATNIDIIFSDELVRFFAEEQLLSGRMYRMDRHDVMPDVPVDGTVEEQLEYCATHIIRVCAREGYFELTPDGLRRLSPNDIAEQDSGIHFGDGWYAIEQYSPKERFRWVDNDAEVVVDLPSDPPPPLIFDLEPGPGVGCQPFRLQVHDAAGTVMAETIVAQRLRLELQLPGGSRRITFRLHVPMGGAPKSDDPRIMNFRVFSCNWAGRRSSEAEPKPRPEILTVVRPEHEGYDLAAQPLELSLLRRAARFYGDTGGPVRAARAAMLYHSRSRLFVRKAPLGHDAFDAANGVAPGAGWYELEHFRGETFRWSKGDESELIVSAPDEKTTLLGIQIEPGPGVGTAAFELLVRDESGEIVARTLVERLRYTEIPLPCKPGCTRVFSLSAVGGGRRCPNGDPRTLNFRVYWCGWVGASQRQDQVLPSTVRREALSPGLQWGHGWRTPEVADSGQPYREGRTGAEILLCPPSSRAGGVFLEVEPVPETATFALEIRDSAGHTLASGNVEGRTQLHIPLPLRAERTAVLCLCVAGDERSSGRFRVFRWAWSTAVLEPPRAPGIADVRPRWGARVVSSEGDVLGVPSRDPAQIRITGSNAAFLHTNTCGDFTLMAREHWFELRGYPEFDLYSFNIDSVLCYTAHHAGFREEMLRDPMRCYHIEHGLGSGWTPEGQAKLFDRLRASGVSWVDYPEVVLWIDQMRRFNSPMIFNLENWGLSGFELPERVVGCLESMQGHT